MTWQQSFVVAWIQFAVAAALLLGGALVAIRRLRQPAERARLVPFVLASALTVPLLAVLAPWPVWNLGWIGQSTAPAASVSVAMPKPPLAADKQGRTASAMQSTPGRLALAEGDVRGDGAQGARQSASEISAAPPWSRWSILAAAILVLHGAAAAWFSAQWCAGRWQLYQLCRSASSPSAQVSALWQTLSGKRGERIRLLVSAEVDAPLVFGWLRPTIVVPQRMVSGDIACVRYCLMHEWSHIDRGDLGAWKFVAACKYVLWYQPAYWALARELRICQEFLADHRSAASDKDRLEYSELLVTLAKNRLAAPVAGALNLLDEPSAVGRRVRMLIEGTSLAVRCRRRVACCALVVSLLAACAFSMIRLESALADNEPPAQTWPGKFHPSIAEAKEAEKRDAQPGSLPAALDYAGQVVDKVTKKPIAGAAVVVRRSDSSKRSDRIIEESKHTTDSEGKFSFVIPPQQVAVSRLYIELDVEHPDYAAKKGFGYGLTLIRKNESLGDPPFFAKTELSPADAVTGTVLNPDGKPLAGVKIQGFSRAKLNDHSFVDTVTGADGKFRLPLAKDGLAVLWVTPKDYAIVQRYLGTARGDLGEFKLDPGIRVSGQVLDAAGKPAANVPVNMFRERSPDDADFDRLAVFTSVRRSALTDAEGRFSYDPLPPGDYLLSAEDHLIDPLQVDRRRFDLPDVFLSQKIALEVGTAAEPLRLQGVPYVTFQAQYYNSRGEKTNGHEPRIWGQLDGNYWHGEGNVVDGQVVIKVPRGLEKPRLALSTNEHSSLRYRLKKGDPLKSERFDIDLGTMNDDMEGVEIIRYVAPVVLVKAVDEAGQPIIPFKVAAAYPWGQQRFILEGETRSDLTFERQPDGRQRSEQLLPDEQVTFTAMAEGYENASETLSLPEGELKELTLTLKKKTPGQQSKPATEPETETKKE